MDRQILSQDEINALLHDSEPQEQEQLTPLQKDALGEIGNICYGSASTALSDMLRKRVIIDTPSVRITTQREIIEAHPIPYVIVEVNYKQGISGSNVLILKLSDSAIIADLMMGGEGDHPSSDLDEMGLSAVGEAMNQMVGSASTSLSTLFSKRVDIDPPKIDKVNFAEDKAFIKTQGLDDPIVTVAFRMKIGELIDSEIMLIMPCLLAIELADSLLGTTEPSASTAQSSPLPVPPPPARSIPVEQTFAPPPPLSIPPPMAAAPEYRQPQVMVQPAQFGQLGANKPGRETGNIGLIMDVPLQVTVELGNTRMKIKEILELGLGSIIELEKLAGDPVDVFVNGKLIAKGEVVVIDENFGIKITDIVSPVERANTLQ